MIVLIVLYVGSQLASSLMMSSPTMDRNQRMIMLFMPLFFVFFVINFPAGVLVYWITTNTWTMTQQFVIKRRIGPAIPAVARCQHRRFGDDERRSHDTQRSQAESTAPGQRRRAGRQWPRLRWPGGPEWSDPRSRQVLRWRRDAGRDAPGGSAAQAAAQEEEALRTAQVTVSVGTTDPAERLRDLLERIAESAGVDVSVEIEDGPDGLNGEYRGDDVALLIGRHGQTIDAIQHLAYRIAMQGVSERRSVTVDAAGYRERRARDSAGGS